MATRRPRHDWARRLSARYQRAWLRFSTRDRVALACTAARPGRRATGRRVRPAREPRRGRRAAARTPARRRRSGPTARRSPAAPSGGEPRPDPPARQVERDRDPGDQEQRRRARRCPGPGPLGDQQGVLADVAQLDGEVRRLAGARVSPGPRASGVEVLRRSACRRRPCRRPRYGQHDELAVAVGVALEQQLQADVAARARPASRTASRRPRRSAAPAPSHSGWPVGVADDEVRRRPEAVLVERVAGDRERVVDPDRLAGDLAGRPGRPRGRS